MSENKGSFSKWKEKINKKVNTLSYAMDRTKARKQITQIQEEIVVLKQKIGDIVHKNRKNDFTLELVATQLVQIEEKETAIVQLEAQIEELNELSRLAGLEVEEGAESAVEFVNEPLSTESVETEQKAPSKNQFTCPDCKQSYEEPKKFCQMCGHKMEG